MIAVVGSIIRSAGVRLVRSPERASMRRARCSVALVLIGVTAATAGAAANPERLPKAKPGPILPSAGGVVLGTSSKRDVVASWGAPSTCFVDAREYCIWQRGMSPTVFGRPSRPGVLMDYAMVYFDASRTADAVQFTSSDSKKSRLRGWMTPEGIRIGSTYQALKRAYPKSRSVERDLGTEGRNSSSWAVIRYEFEGSAYYVRFLLDRNLAQRNAGHVRGIFVDLQA